MHKELRGVRGTQEGQSPAPQLLRDARWSADESSLLGQVCDGNGAHALMEGMALFVFCSQIT